MSQNETIVRVTADASGYSAALEKGVRSAEAFMAAQQTAAQRTKVAQDAIMEAARNGTAATERQINAFVSRTARMAETVGKTRSQLLEQRAAQLGVTSAVSEYIDKLKAAEAAAGGLRRVQGELNATGVSARQTAAAMRMVPAQMTDIVTQLAGGQSPLLVLTQQGGQLKDMFGGVGPAVRALGTYVAGLVNPFTLSAAAAGGLMYVVSRGASEAEAFTRSLTMTGNIAGITADRMATMAASISAVSGTHGKAAETLAAIAGTGKVAADQMEGIAQAAQAMEKATGAAVDDTIAKFVGLADEPVKASLKLNEQYHYLTAAVYEQIAALEEQGRKDEAAAMAQQALADSMRARAEKVVANLGYMERAWNAIAGAAKSAWDQMLGLGRAATLDEIKGKIAGVQGEIAKMESGTGFAGSGGGAAFGAGARGRTAALAKLRTELADLQRQAAPLEGAAAKAAADSERQRQDEIKIAALGRLDAQKKATRSRADQRAEEIAQLKKDAQTVGMAADEYAQRAAAINEKYKDPKGPKPKEHQDDAATRFIQQLRDQDAAVRAALESTEKLTGAEKAYAEFLQKMADLKGKTLLTAEQKSLAAAQERIKAQFQQNIADERALKLKEEIAKVEERTAQIAEQLRNSQDSRREGYARELEAFGQGAEALRKADAVRALTKEFERMQWQLEKATKIEARNSQAYLEGQAAIRAGLAQSIQDYDAYYTALQEKQADWRNGATAAVENYLESTRNMAAQTERAVSNMARGMEDAIVQFAMTGKLNFKDFAMSVIADLVRIQARAAASGLMQSLVSAGISLFSMGAGAVTQGSAWNGFSTGPSAVGATGMSATGTFGNGLSGVFLPGRAAGGPVAANSPYIVGEVGPELFVPDSAGTVVPNHALRGAGSMTVTSAPVIHIDSRADRAQVQADVERAVEQGNARLIDKLQRAGMI